MAFSVVQRGVYVYFFIRRSLEHHIGRDFFLNLETDSAHSVSWDREWVVLPADASQEEIRRIKERQAGIITPEQLNRLIDMLSQMNDPEYESAPCRLTLDAGGKHYGSVTALFAAKEIPPFLEELMKENP